jgi:pimeloyl-ACP methyl ester carboxylesterase
MRPFRLFGKISPMLTTLLITLLATVLALVALFIGATTLLFWYETINEGDASPLHPLGGPRALAWTLRGALNSVRSQLTILLTSPAAIAPKLWLPKASADGAPRVVFIHGIYHNASAWIVASRRFARAGLTDQRTLSYCSFGRDFTATADRLALRLVRELDKEPQRRIVLVGHSMGGLLIRALLKYPTIARHTDAVVTLGTPHQGSKLAALALGRLAKDIRLDGPAIRAIRNAEPTPPCPCLSLYSPVDAMVLPGRALRINLPGWTEQMTRPVSHIGLLYDAEAARAATAFITQACADARQDAGTAADSPQPSVPA